MRRYAALLVACILASLCVLVHAHPKHLDGGGGDGGILEARRSSKRPLQYRQATVAPSQTDVFCGNFVQACYSTAQQKSQGSASYDVGYACRRNGGKYSRSFTFGCAVNGRDVTADVHNRLASSGQAPTTPTVTQTATAYATTTTVQLAPGQSVTRTTQTTTTVPAVQFAVSTTSTTTSTVIVKTSTDSTATTTTSVEHTTSTATVPFTATSTATTSVVQSISSDTTTTSTTTAFRVFFNVIDSIDVNVEFTTTTTTLTTTSTSYPPNQRRRGMRARATDIADTPFCQAYAVSCGQQCSRFGQAAPMTITCKAKSSSGRGRYRPTRYTLSCQCPNASLNQHALANVEEQAPPTQGVPTTTLQTLLLTTTVTTTSTLADQSAFVTAYNTVSSPTTSYTSTTTAVSVEQTTTTTVTPTTATFVSRTTNTDSTASSTTTVATTTVTVPTTVSTTNIGTTSVSKTTFTTTTGTENFYVFTETTRTVVRTTTTTATAIATPSNLVQRPGFEGLTPTFADSGQTLVVGPWQLYNRAGIATSNGQARSGSDQYSGGGYGSLQQGISGLDTAATYRVTVWVEPISGDDPHCTLNLVMDQENSAYIDATSDRGQYRQLVIQRFQPSQSNSNIGVIAQCNSGSAVWRVDDASVVMNAP